MFVADSTSKDEGMISRYTRTDYWVMYFIIRLLCLNFPRGGRRLHNPLHTTCWKESFMSSSWSNHKISLTNYLQSFSYIIGQQVVKVMSQLSSFCLVSIIKQVSEGQAVEQQADAKVSVNGIPHSFTFVSLQADRHLKFSSHYHPILIRHSESLITEHVAHA